MAAALDVHGYYVWLYVRAKIIVIIRDDSNIFRGLDEKRRVAYKRQTELAWLKTLGANVYLAYEATFSIDKQLNTCCFLGVGFLLKDL